MSLQLRYMQPADIAAVVEIDKASFPGDTWSARSYHFEITQSLCSYMVVLEECHQPPPQPRQKWWQKLFGAAPATQESGTIVGYGGLWNIDAEGHISTIASHPKRRGRSYGEILFAAMCRRALMLGAGYIVLEVRVSNTVAQNLYLKYGFEIVATKRNYYRSDNEDAYDMRIDLENTRTVQQLEAHYQAIKQRIPFTDNFSHTLHPRLGK